MLAMGELLKNRKLLSSMVHQMASSFGEHGTTRFIGKEFEVKGTDKDTVCKA